MRTLSLNKIIVGILLVVIILSLIYFVNTYTIESFDNDIPEFGVVITRHVKNKESDKIWKKCIEQIRKFYPSEPIVIIDDGSDYEFINTEDIDMKNIRVIDSEIKRAGEMLPYHYFYKQHWFKRMLFIHDSVFIEQRIDDTSVIGAKTLWHFVNTQNDNGENETAKGLLQYINYNNELSQLYDSSHLWRGSYGVMCIIDHDYLTHIMEKYNVENMIPHIDSRIKRMACERLFGLMLSHDNPEFVVHPSIFGYFVNNVNNRQSFNYKYDDYMEDVSSGNMRAPINKLFFGR